MEVVENKTLNGETVVMDDKFFVNCHLTNCPLLFSGGEVSSRDTKFENCPIQFSGAAARTVALLASMGMLKPGVFTPPAAPPAGKVH